VPEKDFALGSYEAAAIMGVHFTRPRLMAKAGKLVSRPLASGVKSPKSMIHIYSRLDCDQEFKEYEQRVALNGGTASQRPRAWLHLRPKAQKLLANVVQIEYADACSVQEASDTLRLAGTSQITRLIRSGDLVGRKAWNPRHSGSQGEAWIISRRSVEERKNKIVAAETVGKKRGIRKFVAKRKTRSR